jgi:hypothetical protein
VHELFLYVVTPVPLLLVGHGGDDCNSSLVAGNRRNRCASFISSHALWMWLMALLALQDDANHPGYQRIGFVSQFGDVTKQVTLTKNEGTLGMSGEGARTSHLGNALGSSQSSR